LVHLLADDHGVGAVAAATTNGLGHGCPEEPRVACLEVKVARDVAGALPLVDVRQDFPFDERPHGLAELFAFGRIPNAH
jgi:hypothetical protein